MHTLQQPQADSHTLRHSNPAPSLPPSSYAVQVRGMQTAAAMARGRQRLSMLHMPSPLGMRLLPGGRALSLLAPSPLTMPLPPLPPPGPVTSCLMRSL